MPNVVRTAREIAAERRGFRLAMQAVRDGYASVYDPETGINWLDDYASWEVRDHYLEAIAAACRDATGRSPETRRRKP